MINDIKKDAEQRMQRGVEAFKEDIRKLRTGRAHAGLLEHVMVDYYGTNVPVKQTANVSVEDARTLVVFGDHLFLQRILELAERLAAHVTQRHTPALGVLTHHLHEIPAPFFGHGRQRHATHLACGDGIKT